MNSSDFESYLRNTVLLNSWTHISGNLRILANTHARSLEIYTHARSLKIHTYTITQDTHMYDHSRYTHARSLKLHTCTITQYTNMHDHSRYIHARSLKIHIYTTIQDTHMHAHSRYIHARSLKIRIIIIDLLLFCICFIFFFSRIAHMLLFLLNNDFLSRNLTLKMGEKERMLGFILTLPISLSILGPSITNFWCFSTRKNTILALIIEILSWHSVHVLRRPPREKMLFLLFIFLNKCLF